MKLLLLVTLTIFITLDSYAQKNIERHLQKGKNAYQREQYNKAVSCFEKILKLDIKNSTAYVWKARSHEALKEYKEAFEAFEAALNIAPSSETYKHRAAMKSSMALSGMELPSLCDCGSYIMPSESGDIDALAYYHSATKDYEEAIQLDNKNADTFYRAAITYYYLGKYDKTCNYLQQATKLGHEKPIPPQFTEHCKE